MGVAVIVMEMHDVVCRVAIVDIPPPLHKLVNK